MIDDSFLGSLDRLALIVNKRVTSKYTGERKSVYSGSGTQFKDHRLYALGDNFKSIDWRVFARTDDLYIKIYEEERNLDVHILLDATKSMDYKEKFDYAGKIALGLAFLATKNNERIHFATFSDKLEIYRGDKGKRPVLSMIDHINNMKPNKKMSLKEAILRYKSMLHSRSYIAIVSDYLYTTDEIKDALRILGTNHTVKVIQVMHEDETKMPLEGDYKFMDTENSLDLRTYVSPRSKEHYLKRLEEHTHAIREFCNNHRMTFTPLTTDITVFEAIASVIGQN